MLLVTPGWGWRKSQLGSSLWPQLALSGSGKNLAVITKTHIQWQSRERSRDVKNTQWHLRQKSTDLFSNSPVIQSCTALGILNNSLPFPSLENQQIDHFCNMIVAEMISLIEIVLHCITKTKKTKWEAQTVKNNYYMCKSKLSADWRITVMLFTVPHFL